MSDVMRLILCRKLFFVKKEHQMHNFEDEFYFQMEIMSQFVAQHAIRLQSKNVDRNVSSALLYPCPSTVSFPLDFGHLRVGDTHCCV